MRLSSSRLAVSVGLIGALLGVCMLIPAITHAAMALLLVLANVALAKLWGRSEALAAAIVGVIGFDYYFLPPRGFAIKNPEQWVAFFVLCVTLLVTGQLVAQSEQRRKEALGSKHEIERLYSLVNVLVESDSAESTMSNLAGKLLEIFGSDGVALYDRHTGLIARSGPRADAVSDATLREIVTSGFALNGSRTGLSMGPIRHGDQTVGSFAMSGSHLSEPVLETIAGRLGLGLARLYTIEKTTEAEAIRRSEELKSAVLDAMAHEIRNPLNSVKVAVTTLLSGTGDEEQTREMLAVIDEEAERMDHLIDDAVQLSRAEAGGLSLNREPSNMATLIPEAVEGMGVAASRRPIRLSVPEALPAAMCDKALIAQVLRQLLSNAFKYSPPGSPLTVTAESTDASIVINVVDCGPGVKAEEREHIFEKYYRGQAARRGTTGTGLGLASARSIVRAHGGDIWVTDAPAGGAAFHVSLPVVDGNGAATQ